MTEPNHSNSEKPNANATTKVRVGSKQRVREKDGSAHAPFKREEVMSDLQHALKATANHIAVAGADGNVAALFLGFSIKDDASFGAEEIDEKTIRLERFAITKIIDNAYDFAFQVGPRPKQHTMDEADYLRMLTFRRGSPRFVWGGVDTPMSDDDAPISRTIDTADARMRIHWKFGLTVRQLALLANMSEPAVRTSLSKEGIKTAGGRNDRGLAEIPIEEAQPWLEGRRGFVATLEPEPTDPFYADDVVRLFKANGFDAGLSNVSAGASLSKCANEARVDPNWLLELASGRPAKLDMEALDRVAQQICADAPAFIGNAVAAVLRANADAKGVTE